MSSPAIISVNGGRRTRVRVEGDPAHPPVVLLHGVGSSLEDWGHQYPRLAAAHRVIALDLPGSGFSARSPEPTTLDVLARGVIETLDSLEEHRPAHVVGNSLGGAVAMQLLARHPQRVSSLVLVSSAGFGAEAALLLRLLATPVLGDLLGRRTTRGGARMIERMTFADPRLATTARIEHALAIAAQPDTNTVLLETTRALATFRGARPGWRAELIAAVAKHPRPTLILWGDRDRILPAHQLDAAHRLLPHAQTHLFAGVGHKPQIECPDDFAARVLAFLAEAERSGQPDRPKADSTRPRRSARMEVLDGRH